MEWGVRIPYECYTGAIPTMNWAVGISAPGWSMCNSSAVDFFGKLNVVKKAKNLLHP